MSRGRVLHVVLASLFWGCAPGVPAQPAPAPPPPVAAGPTPPPLASAPVTQVVEKNRLPIRFLALPQAAEDQPPHVEIVFPIVGKRIEKERAPDYEVKLKTERWEPELSLLMALDDYPPLVFSDPGRPVRLGELLPANRELEPGVHRLYAAARAKSGRMLGATGEATVPSRAPYAMVPFWVGPDPDQQSTSAMKSFESPMLVLWSPHGTFNGDTAADQLTVEFQVLGAGLGSGAHSVLLQVLAANETHESVLVDTRPVRVMGLPSGDHVIAVTLLDAAGKPVVSPYASQSVTVTVNRDAPVE